MPDDSIPRSILLLILILISAYFAGAETAFSYCNQLRVRTLADSGNRQAKNVLYILDHFDSALVTILVGTNVTHVAASTIATLLAVSLLGPSGSIVATIVLTLLVFLFCETIPKNIAKTNCDRISMTIAGSMRWLIWVLSPVNWLLTRLANFISRVFSSSEKAPTMTEDEFHSMIESIEEEGVLEPEESELIQSAIEFSDTRVQDVMTPREVIVAIDIHATKSQIKDTLLSEKYSRFPVYSGNLDHITGILNTHLCLKALQEGTLTSLSACTQPACFVTPDMTLDDAFERMGGSRRHLAIVRDRGKTLGLISMEDVLEQIVGEIYDEDDTGVAEDA